MPLPSIAAAAAALAELRQEIETLAEGERVPALAHFDAAIANLDAVERWIDAHDARLYREARQAAETAPEAEA